MPICKSVVYAIRLLVHLLVPLRGSWSVYGHLVRMKNQVHLKEQSTTDEGISRGGNRAEHEDVPSERSKLVRASEHIITERTLTRWFTKPPVVEVEVEELSKMVEELLRLYKEYFDTVVQNEPWCQATCLSDFKKVMEEVLDGDREQYNWARVAMLLALATRVSQLFYKNGATCEFVRQFSRDVGMCLDDKVHDWCQNGDKWVSLRPENGSAGTYNKTYLCILGASAVVASFVTTVVKLSMAYPLFLYKFRQ